MNGQWIMDDGQWNSRRCFKLPVICCLLVFSLSIFHNPSSIASDPSSEFQKANALYQKQEYDSSIRVYEKLIASSGIAGATAEVYYNLANTYYKVGNTPKAIINYERALKINPDDEDALFNLRVAQLKVVDKIEPLPQIFYKRWITGITELFTTTVWSRLLIAFVWITFIVAILYIFSSSPSIRRLVFVLGVVFLFITASAWFFAHQSYMESEVRKDAIVTTASAYIKSSPDEKGNDLFILHEGTKVSLLDDFNDWKKIRIANGSIGWLKSSDIEEI